VLINLSREREVLSEWERANLCQIFGHTFHVQESVIPKSDDSFQANLEEMWFGMIRGFNSSHSHDASDDFLEVSPVS